MCLFLSRYNLWPLKLTWPAGNFPIEFDDFTRKPPLWSVSRPCLISYTIHVPPRWYMMVWYLPSLKNTYHLRAICSIWESQPPICTLRKPYAAYIRPTCCPYTRLFSTWYTYVQAIAYHSVSILLFISCLWLMYCQYYIHTWDPYNTL